jgi:hypothetical protein
MIIMQKNIDDRDGFKIAQDPAIGTVPNDVSLRIEKTDEKLPYIQIEKEAKGNHSEVRQRAEQIKIQL